MTEYFSVASSPDGRTLLAGSYPGPIYFSTNAGSAWGELRPPVLEGPYSNRITWQGVACSADGSTIAAAAFGGPICVSTNAGASWVESPFGDGFHGVTCSADGKTVVAAADHYYPAEPGGIYLSHDGGLSWTQPDVNIEGVHWWCPRCSADGTKIAVAGGRGVYISTNSGATWEAHMSDKYFATLACSADGRKMIAGDWELFTSADGGANWTKVGLTGTGFWSVACSADGGKFVAANHGGGIYFSGDGGVNWEQTEAPLANWYAVAVSADGNACVASTMPADYYTGQVYICRLTPAPLVTAVGSGEAIALSWTVPSREFVLQHGLSPGGTEWTDVVTSPVLNLNTLRQEIILPKTGASGFYRLMSR